MPLILTYRKILSLLSAREKRQYALLALVSLIMAILELFSIAAIIPILAVVANPEIVETNVPLRRFAGSLGLTGRNDVLIVLASAVFCVVMLSIAGRALTFHLLMRFSRMRALSLAMRLMRLFLARDYLWHVARESADLGRKALDEVREVVIGPLDASLRLISNGAVLVLIIAMLVALQPVAALAAAALMMLCYGSAFLLIQRQLSTLGQEWQSGNAYRYQVMQEALGGIREVKLFGLQQFYLRRYHDPAERVARTKARINTLAELPRYVLEAVAFGGMLLFLILMLVSGGDDLARVLPILGTYAVAGVRLFPTVQTIYRAHTIMVTGEPMVDSLLEDLTAADAPDHVDDLAGSMDVALPFERVLELHDISFAYPGGDRLALSHCSVTIPRGAMVGFAGSTGAGKSTLIDIMSGLIAPNEGAVLVDGHAIDAANAPAWRANVGYVPQAIFLVDDTIAQNIAFGVDPATMDMSRVRDAARIAQIDDFIMALPDGYDTRAGERGKRLSGGQRQRIAIARALYRRPSFLIFDEATSALDPATEDKVMRAIARQAGDISIVLIAHRLASLRQCDTVHMLDHGQIVASGGYDDFAAGTAGFRTSQGERRVGLTAR